MLNAVNKQQPRNNKFIAEHGIVFMLYLYYFEEVQLNKHLSHIDFFYVMSKITIRDFLVFLTMFDSES